MKCIKCSGLVIKDILLCESSYWLNVVRCINCGWVKLQELEKVTSYTNHQIKDRRVVDELELYRIRSRGRLRTTTLRTTTY